MKRFFCMLLTGCLLLSLCACGTPPAPEVTEPPVTEAPTEPLAVSEPEPAYFSLKTLPEIGAYVSDEKQESFFADGPHAVFEPRADYGEVAPYIGHTSVYREVPSYTYTDEDGSSTVETVENRALYYGSGIGLMTRNGKLICQPVYDYFISAEDRGGNKIWILNTENPDEMYCYAPTVVAGDGSWKLDFPFDSNIEAAEGAQLGYFTVMSNQGNYNRKEQIYSFDGTLLADLDAIRKKYETPEEELSLTAVDGDRLLFQFCQPDDDEDDYSYDEDDDYSFDDDEETAEDAQGYDYFYTDLKGNKLSDLQLALPYDEACGACIVGYDYFNQEVQLFSADGTPLTKAVQGYCHCDQANQRILIYNMDSNTVKVFDGEGNALSRYQMDWNWFEYGPNGVVFLDQEACKAYRASDGSELELGLDGIEIIYTVSEVVGNNEPSNLYITAISGEKCYLFDLEGHQIACVHKPFTEQQDYDFDDGRLYYDMDLYVTPDYVLSVSQTDHWYLFDRATKQEQLLPIHDIPLHHDEDDPAFAMLYFYGSLMGVYFGQMNDDMGENSRTDLYDLKTGRVLYTDLQFYDQTPDLLLLQTKRAAVALEMDGTVLLNIHSDSLF